MVYFLEPKQYNWIRAAGAHEELLQKQIDGVPLRQSDIPVETVLKGRLALPDICKAGDAFRFVSDRAKAAFEELVPGCVAFFPLNLKAPEFMLTSRAFFFIDVLPRAQLIDWDLSPTVPRNIRTPDGRDSRFINGLMTDPTTKYRAVTPDTPPIWREVDVDRPTVHFFANKQHVLLRDDLWEALNARFPRQLVARKLA